MKKILFVAIAATLLAAGCQKTEIINRVGDAMTFSTEMGKLTKAASEEGLTTLKSQNFYVWAFCAYEDAINNVSKGDVHENMEYLTIKFDETTNKWVTEDSKDYYWPGKEKDLDFFAVSGNVSSENVGISGGNVEEGSRTLNVKDYVVEESVATDDLMIADFVRQNQEDENAEGKTKVVDLTFRHALSKVQFLFKTSENNEREVVVKSIKVTGVVTKGDLAVSENDPKFTWTTSAEASDAKEFEKTEDLTLTKDAVTYATWLMIPQTFATKDQDNKLTGLTVSVSYTMGAKEFESSFPLYTDQLLAWASNQYIKYTVLLTPNLITFNPSVEDWTSPSEEGMVN